MKTRKLIAPISLVIILGMLASVTYGCKYIPKDHGSGNYVKEVREVSNFTRLDVGGAFKVYLTQGDQEKLTVEADQEEIKDVKTEVVGNKLKISLDSDWGVRTHEISIYLTFKNLDFMEFSGAVEVKGEMPLTFADLGMDISGAVELEMNIKADKLEAEFSGASEVDFSGSCKTGDLELSGASDFDAQGFEFQDLSIDVSGASDAKVWATGLLNIDASGASSIRYKGSPKISIDESGASSVKPL
jgi:hypothetical protein